jgi:hypothetical protein
MAKPTEEAVLARTTKAALAVLLVAACVPPQPVCSFACVKPGYAATAGHCVERTEPAVLVPAPSCQDAPATRQVQPGELAMVGARTLHVVDRWLTWLVLDGPCYPGESGSGVYGADQALLGVVVENHSGRCYAEPIEQ